MFAELLIKANHFIFKGLYAVPDAIHSDGKYRIVSRDGLIPYHKPIMLFNQEEIELLRLEFKKPQKDWEEYNDMGFEEQCFFYADHLIPELRLPQLKSRSIDLELFISCVNVAKEKDLLKAEHANQLVADAEYYCHEVITERYNSYHYPRVKGMIEERRFDLHKAILLAWFTFLQTGLLQTRIYHSNNPNKSLDPSTIDMQATLIELSIKNNPFYFLKTQQENFTYFSLEKTPFMCQSESTSSTTNNRRPYPLTLLPEEYFSALNQHSEKIPCILHIQSEELTSLKDEVYVVKESGKFFYYKRTSYLASGEGGTTFKGINIVTGKKVVIKHFNAPPQWDNPDYPSLNIGYQLAKNYLNKSEFIKVYHHGIGIKRNGSDNHFQYFQSPLYGAVNIAIMEDGPVELTSALFKLQISKNKADRFISETDIRIFAETLCSALETMASLGIAGFDWAGYNILVDEHFNVKLCDFDDLRKTEPYSPDYWYPIGLKVPRLFYLRAYNNDGSMRNDLNKASEAFADELKTKISSIMDKGKRIDAFRETLNSYIEKCERISLCQDSYCSLKV